MEKDFLISCQKEYSTRKYFITGISLQSKDVGMHISYDTVHSAFIYTLSGEALIQFNDESFTADENTIVHGASNQKIDFSVVSDVPFVHLNIYYDPENPWHGCSDIMNTAYEISEFNKENTSELLSKLKKCANSVSFDDQIRSRMIAGQLILSSFCYSMPDKEIMQIENAIELIESSYQKSLRLEDLALAADMNKAHFSYTFNKIYNIRPIDYLIRLRLRKAAKMLLDGMSVTEASINVGYQDPLYFSRLYKKYFGIPPSKTWRKV